MQYIKVNDPYEFFAMSFFIILAALGWMIYRNFKPFIRFEENTAQLFRRKFGNPQMNYSDYSCIIKDQS